MRLIELLEKRTGAMKVGEVAKVLGVSPQQIYKMAASGSIPSLRISGAIRFDPGEIADWLKKKKRPTVNLLPSAHKPSVAA
jgi:excisionase family DNA binding protein